MTMGIRETIESTCLEDSIEDQEKKNDKDNYQLLL